MQISEAGQAAEDLLGAKYGNRPCSVFLDDLALKLYGSKRKTDKFVLELPADNSELECLLQFARELRGRFETGNPAILAVWRELVEGCEAETNMRSMKRYQPCG